MRDGKLNDTCGDVMLCAMVSSIYSCDDVMPYAMVSSTIRVVM